METINVKVGPQYYLYKEDAIDTVPKLLNEYSAKKIIIIHGGISWNKAKQFLNFLDIEKYEFMYHKYSGECSYQEAEIIKDLILSNDIDFMIGVGGGKLADLVGYTAHIANINFGVIPTLASNCAPWTPLSVMYKESGEAEGKTEHYLRQASFFITDPNLVIDAPVEYFVAGLADTIAKWHESDLILQQDHLKEEPFLKLARYTADLCNKAIIDHGSKAIEDMKNKVVSEEFIHLSEIVFGVAGLVGGLGDKFARNAAAHAMHDAMSKYLVESHNFLHGEKVAYGIFFQIALEERCENIDTLLQFYQDLNLPMSLTEMGIMPTEEILDDIVSFIYSKEKVHLIPIEITEEKIRQTIYDLEDYINKVKEDH